MIGRMERRKKKSLKTWSLNLYKYFIHILYTYTLLYTYILYILYKTNNRYIIIYLYINLKHFANKEM